MPAHPEDYIHICTCKTAYLFSACAAIGGDQADLTPDQSARLAAFGIDFGLAFQITDDTLDYTASDEQWGKNTGGDLAQGKQTLPLILTLQSASEDERRELEQIVDEGHDLVRIRGIMNRHRALERSIELAEDYTQRALDNLEGLPVKDQSAYDLLLALPEFINHRRY